MKIAVPTFEGKLAEHFGHCSQFVFVEVDGNDAIVGSQALTPPAHAPGVLPAWLRENGADVIIAGGMGRRAQDLFAEAGIQVIVGAPALPPEELAALHLEGRLEAGMNICDH